VLLCSLGTLVGGAKSAEEESRNRSMAVYLSIFMMCRPISVPEHKIDYKCLKISKEVTLTYKRKCVVNSTDSF
jgi:hypothetical protein